MKHILQNVTKDEQELIRKNKIVFRKYNYTSEDIYTHDSESYKKIIELIGRN